MARIKIDRDGEKRYYNDEGNMHREDGPAVIWPNGTKFWYIKDWCVRSQTRVGRIAIRNHPHLTEEEPNGWKVRRMKGTIIWPEL